MITYSPIGLRAMSVELEGSAAWIDATRLVAVDGTKGPGITWSKPTNQVVKSQLGDSLAALVVTKGYRGLAEYGSLDRFSLPLICRLSASDENEVQKVSRSLVAGSQSGRYGYYDTLDYSTELTMAHFFDSFHWREPVRKACEFITIIVGQNNHGARVSTQLCIESGHVGVWHP